MNYSNICFNSNKHSLLYVGQCQKDAGIGQIHKDKPDDVDTNPQTGMLVYSFTHICHLVIDYNICIKCV